MRRSAISLLLACIFFYASPVLANAAVDTIYDQTTGLVQQQQTAENFPWEGALAYCEGLVLAEESDWRLPNIRELKSLVVRTFNDPSINPIFEYVYSGSYWSSTSLHPSSPVSIIDKAWTVHFYDGRDITTTKSYPDNNVRCVRSGLPSSSGMTFPWGMYLPAIIEAR